MRAYQLISRPSFPGTLNALTETRLATLERIAPDLLEIRYKPEQKLDVEGLREVMRERERLCPEGPYRVLAVFPPEGDFDLGVMMHDHYAGRGLENCTRMLAIAASSTLIERMVNLYYAYYPQRFRMQVFLQEEDARRWLAGTVGVRSLN